MCKYCDSQLTQIPLYLIRTHVGDLGADLDVGVVEEAREDDHDGVAALGAVQLLAVDAAPKGASTYDVYTEEGRG